MKTLLTLIIFTIFSTASGQEFVVLNLRIISKVDKQPLPFCAIKIYQEGNKYDSLMSGIEGIGSLKFSNLSPIILTVDNNGYKAFDTIINTKNFNNELLISLDTINEDINYHKIYNRETAYSDIKAGNVKILFVGLIFKDEQDKINKCCAKYGFTYTFTNDFISGHLAEAVENYNKIVLQYLDLRNKSGWKNELKRNCGIALK